MYINLFFILEETVTGYAINITKVNRLHMGRYKCIADNGIAPSAIQYYSIETHCKYLPNYFIALVLENLLTKSLSFM